MNNHEYQGKELFRSAGVKVQKEDTVNPLKMHLRLTIPLAQKLLLLRAKSMPVGEEKETCIVQVLEIF